MGGSDRESLLEVLESVAAGQGRSASELLPLVYKELRALARSRMAQLTPGHTLQPTALVHDAYLRLVGDCDPGWDGRGHFFGAAARAMRDIVVEHARAKAALKRGGDRQRYDMADLEFELEGTPDDILAVHEAVEELEAADPRKGQIVNLRYFARFTVAETATILGISEATVRREWRFIRSWLQKALASAK